MHTKTEARIDDERLLELRWRRRSVHAARGVCPLPTAFGPRGGKAHDVIISNAASTSVAAGARRRIAEKEVVAGGTDVNVGGGSGSGGGTYSLIVNRLALHRNRPTPRGGSLT